jgi:hypothetical protein
LGGRSASIGGDAGASTLPRQSQIEPSGQPAWDGRRFPPLASGPLAIAPMPYPIDNPPRPDETPPAEDPDPDS